MKINKPNFALFIFCLFIAHGVTASAVKVAITKDSNTQWYVTYSAASDVSRLVFVRNPDKSRAQRWSALSDAFYIGFEDGKEYIARKDAASFHSVSLALTPTYLPLAKEYAPFSPFSDGGMLFHSARFFVCANVCTRGLYAWEMTLTATPQDNIIVRGNVARESMTWMDSKNGQKVYVGNATPRQDSHFISVIDRRLPDKLRQSIHDELPQLMDFFSTKFGRLGYRPSLYASYSKSENGSYGNQGGTLPAQIFMHWYGNKSIQPFDAKANYWFFAHEVVHLYQGKASLADDPADAWIHEGAAELFAGLLATPGYLAKRLARAQRQCKKGMKKTPSYASAVKKRPILHYACGLVLLHAIKDDLASRGDITIFDLWKRYNQVVSEGAAANAQTFVNTVTPYLTAQLGQALSTFVATDSLDLSTLVSSAANHSAE